MDTQRLRLAESFLQEAVYRSRAAQAAGVGLGGGALSEPGLRMPGTRPATKDELMGFFEHLERELDESGFMRPPEKRPAMVRNVRNMFHRMQPTEQDIRTLRGIVASLVRQHLRPKPDRS